MSGARDDMAVHEAAYGLTVLQRDCLWVVQELIEGGVPPTLREIARDLDLASHSLVHELLTLLRQRGYVDWLPARARSLVVRRPIPMPEWPEIVGFVNEAPRP